MEHVEKIIISHYDKLTNLLQGGESLTIDEIKEADNLNYHREWFIDIVKHAMTV